MFFSRQHTGWIRGLSVLMTVVLLLGASSLSGSMTLAANYGDIDGDGSINASDALWALQSSVSLRTLTDEQQELSDVNNDGNVNASDALLILQYSVGLIDRFDAEPLEGRNDLMVEYKNGAYVQSRGEVEIEGARTTFQVSAAYDDTMALPADMVMIYSTDDNGWADWDYDIASMQMMNKANGLEYHTEHPGDLQIQADGRGIYGTEPGEGRAWSEIIQESSRNSYQTQDYINHKKSHIDQMVADYNPQFVVFEEPEYFRRGLYGESYKTLWKDYYSTDWVDPISTPQAVMMSQRLNVALECNAITQLSDHYKSLTSDGLFGIAAHSHFNYRAHDITGGIYSMAATGKVDAIIGQAWSDTIKHTFLYNGAKVQRPFLLGYLEYGTYIDAAVTNGTQLFALIDPRSDEKEKHTEEELRTLNRHQVVSSLMYSEVNRWENCIWPDRSFRDVSSDYKTEILSIYNALNDISGKEYSLTAGTPGVTYLLSDTINWQVTENNWSLDPSQSYYGVAMPLIDDGIPLEIASMDYIQSAEDLEGVSLLLVSYDSMKPQSETVNKAIADWVKQGGTLMYVGGHDAYETLESEWWGTAEGGTPYNNLLYHLGLSSVEVGTFLDMTTLEYTGDESMASLFADKMGIVLGDEFYASYRGEGFTPLLTSIYGDTLAMEAEVGKGHFISVGLPGYYFASEEEGADWMKAMCEYAMRYTDYDYVTSPALKVERGNYTAVHALNGAYTLEGVYVDIFDSTLPIVTDPVIQAGDSGLYYKVEMSDSGVPSAVFYGGELQGEITETAERTSLSLTGPNNSVSTVRLLGAGKVPAAVSATVNGEEYTQIITQWNNATGSMMIELNNSTHDPIDIVVEWTDGEKPDDPVRGFESKMISVGNAGNDQEYIVRFNGGTAEGYRYCDTKAELVYCLDISDYSDNWLSLAISNNYLVEISDHDGDWIEVYNYDTISGGDYASSGSNATSLEIIPSQYGFEHVIYIRIRNCYPEKGWGANLSSIGIYYVETK